VDDDPLSAQFAGDALRSLGFQVSHLPDAESALASVRSGGIPELFLLDVILPGLRGMDLLGALRADSQAAGSAVIMITGIHHRGNLVAALQLGADDFLFKPFDPLELALRARNVVERRAGSRADTPMLRQDVTTLFADVRGFTPLAERIDPETAVTILNDLFETLDAAIAAEGGYVDKFIGDGLMALFLPSGAPHGRELRACRAALQMQALAEKFARESLSLAAHTEHFGIGIGLACGEAVVGPVGTLRKRQYTAIGDPVNLAARLQAGADRGEVIIDGEIAQRVGSVVQVSPPWELQVKGKDQPRRVHRVIAVEEEVEL